MYKLRMHCNKLFSDIYLVYAYGILYTKQTNMRDTYILVHVWVM